MFRMISQSKYNTYFSRSSSREFRIFLKVLPARGQGAGYRNAYDQAFLFLDNPIDNPAPLKDPA